MTANIVKATHIKQRRYDLDWLRIIAFMFLIFYHIGMFYVSWGWHVKSVHTNGGGEWLMSLVNPWRLALLFFISGLAIRFMSDKTPKFKMAKNRALRIGLPIVFGMTFIVVPQAWLQLVENGEFTGSLAAFYPRYLDPASEFTIMTPTWNHLWYIVYLLPYTLTLIIVAGSLARFMEGRGAQITNFLFSGRFGWLNVLIFPVFPHVLIRIFLDPHFPTSHDFVNDWANHAHSITILMTGFLLAKDEAFWNAIKRAMPAACLSAIILGTVLSIAWLNWEALEAAGSSYGWALWPARIGRSVYAWIVIAAFLGIAQRWFNKPSRALSYMTEAIFPWYILHQTIIVMAGFWLTRQNLSRPTEFICVCLATIGGCLIIHEFIIRRASILRPLFGLSWARPSHPTPSFQLR